MAIDNEEHKEILLGNKQLLSIFFIVVVLLGVSFTLGYTIGKNSGKAHESTATVQQPAVVETPAARVASNPEPSEQAPPPTIDAESTVPKAPAHPLKPREVAPEETEPKTVAKKAEPPATTAANGTYLQVAALKREDADRIAAMLRTRGYNATLGDSSKEGLYRVLVGPFKTMADVSESKQKLKASGMDSFVVH